MAAAATLPAVWWEPLHVDEWVTLSIAPSSYRSIVHEIAVHKGGGPVHFFLEHLFLGWPGGIEGLRLPSLIAFAAALPGAGLLARELAGPRESLLTPALLALAPLAVALATFGRMYSLLLAAFLWFTVAGVRAARSGGWKLYAAAGGLGALVYVHPIAPLYAAPALAGALLIARAPPKPALWAGAAFFLAGLPYWLFSLWRLRERYYVGYAGSQRLEATAGRSVPEEIVRAVSAGGRIGAAAFVALAAAGAVALWRRERTREAIVLVAWVVIPIVFFLLVPAGNVEAGGTRFYPRYVLPELPAFLILVAAGCLAFPRAAAAGLAAAAFALMGGSDLNRLQRLHALRLPRAVSAVRSLGHDAVLRPSTGRPLGPGRPSALLDEFVALQVPSARREGRGIEVTIIGGPRRFLDTVARTNPASLVAIRISTHLLVVRSRAPSYR